MMNFKISNRLQVIQAALSVYILSKNEMLRNELDSMKLITEFFAGTADDIGPYEFLNVANSLVNGHFSLHLKQEDFLKQIKIGLDKLPPPRIIGGTSAELVAESSSSETMADKVLNESREMRLIGQRFTLDSYIFSKLVLFEHKGNTVPFTAVDGLNGKTIRGIPRALDVLAVLGSSTARDVLQELGDSNYEGYNEAFVKLQNEIDSYDHDKCYQDLYHRWLFLLKVLLNTFDYRYPTFMQTKAWKHKELTTALASWTQLRHDTILYTKQSYTLSTGFDKSSTTIGYIEPIPELYDRILAIVATAEAFLLKIGTLPEKIQLGFEKLRKVLQAVIAITFKELKNESLSNEEYEFIRDYEHHISSLASYFESPFYDRRDTIVVADVHTDLNSKTILEEGTGYLKILLVAFKLPDGKIYIGAGPVLSYYEFKQPVHVRLNNETWKKILNSDSCPKEPEWIYEYSV